MPIALIIGGPNGAGKTTFATEYLPNEGEILQFVNADLIAAGISPFAPDTADMAAGRAMLARLDELVASRSNFAVESTLSGQWLARKIPAWRSVGYVVELHFVRLRDAELAIARIAKRVSKGGHHVPSDVVRRRYERALLKFEEVYCNLVDRWAVYDNSGHAPKIVRTSSR